MSEKVKNVFKILGIYCGISFILWSLFVIVALVWFDRGITNLSTFIWAIACCLITPISLLFFIGISFLPAILLLYFLFKKYNNVKLRIALTALIIPLMNFIYYVIGQFSDILLLLSIAIAGYTLILFLPTTLVVTYCTPKTLLPIKNNVIKTNYLMMLFYIVIFFLGILTVDKIETWHTSMRLNKYETIIEQLEEYKSKKGVYPVNIEDNIKSFKQFKYKPYYDGSDYVLQVSDSDYWRIEYNYCSNKDDEYCQTGWHNYSVNSKIGEWTKSEEDD